ncbi:hypothetical protein DS909_10295 [Phaeobacter gallaeciensis]|uniref:Sulfotransferase family protein n=2 Tax=Roseobacteraceae TaxID=2854170 RepID=A0A366WYJ2_9RHOB|nr:MULTISPECIES: hypothetical protein [Roseobacteraceae]MBT3143562.1 hypothetical protein [Falsiruegeria litorea]MBT8167832.1 hypothetical protein [Falsiruegeria litorea]RBW55500.1 hypothetical protein DS909_10295 [Phaeobacter gallaeciensis]
MHPIYALWAHPRSMSTAIERIMRERGDLDCAHEPFMYDYYVHRRAGQMPHFDVRADHPQEYSDIRDMLFERAKHQPVFIKDMSYYVMPHILGDSAFQGRLHNAFLVRRPRAAIVSYHKIDPECSCEEIGIAAQLDHAQGLAAQGDTPLVIRSEDVRANPQGMMSALWRAWGLAEADHAFNWQCEAPKDWQQVEGWHAKTMQTQGIEPPDPNAEENERRKFDALAAQVPKLETYLATHEPAYQTLSDMALSANS